MNSFRKNSLELMTSILSFCVIMFLFLVPSLVAAQPGGGGNPSQPSAGGSATLQNPLGNVGLQEFLFKIIDILLVFAIPLIVFFIILAGFTYVTAGGNESKVHKATHMLTWSVIGGVIIVGARAIMMIIENTVNSLK